MFRGLLFALAVTTAASRFSPLPPNEGGDLLPLHTQSPFLSRRQLLSLPKEQLVEMMLGLTGDSSPPPPSRVSETPSLSNVFVGSPPFWPAPKQFTNGTMDIVVDSNSFSFNAGDKPAADLTKAFERYLPLLFPHTVDKHDARNPTLSTVTVTCKNPEAELQLETDESYGLNINKDGSAAITANTQVGVFWALETLSQLVVFDFDNQQYVIRGAPWAIVDSPRFKHRELLVDSSRHFLPIRTLERVLNSMTHAKLNVMHWHLVDSQSFPFDSTSFPLLSQKGAYSQFERYSRSDVGHVIEFARQRGVRVVVEIDVPGHAQSWCAGHPEICPSSSCTTPLSPATNKTFEVLEGLFGDLTGHERGKGLFFDNMMHLGGDEVNTDCWGSDPVVSAWRKKHNFTVDDAYFYFVSRAQAIAHANQRDVVGWEEIFKTFGTKLDKKTIVQQWLPGSTIAKAAIEAGYRVIWSTAGDWYLDLLNTNWTKMYLSEPCSQITDKQCEEFMVGGGGEQWGETVDTSDILQTIWPRAGAVAERLWSPRWYDSVEAAAPRLAAFRCLLNRRGFPAAPLNQPVGRSPPPGPGSCFEQ